MQISRLGPTSAPRTNRYVRFALLLAMFVLTMQLITTAFHKHNLAEELSDCASCVLVAHMPTGVTPADVIAVAPALSVLYFHIPPLALYVYLVQASYLIPPSHAPPRASLPL